MRPWCSGTASDQEVSGSEIMGPGAPILNQKGA